VERSSKVFFDSIGADWDRLRESFFPDRVREAALAAAGVQSGREAADLGAGTGFITQGLLARGVRVIAVDQSPAMLDALRRKFPRPDRVDCRAGDAEHLPIASTSLDYSLANMFLHHVERPAVAVKEMARILKPGGKAVVTDLDTHEFEFLREEHHDRWMGFERDLIRDWFVGAGLTDVRVDSLGVDCCDTSAGGRSAKVGIFIASGTKP
jgi:ubiquinone/menaquinone biosynthesis C-methylase UbiE